MKIVMKFGGTSVGDDEKIKQVVKLIENSIKAGYNPIITISAISGITDSLIEILERAISGDEASVKGFVEELATQHKRIVKKIIVQKEDLMRRIILEIDELIKELERVLISVSYLREASLRLQDYILSFGEKLSAVILRTALENIGYNAKSFTGCEAGIVTDNRFGEARPLMNLTALQVREKLGPLLERGGIPVVTGFIACTQDHITTTLGRGGSDYTATILGSSLEVDEIWIFTDVDGLMTADPKIDPLAKTIPCISYAEAMEMAYFGAKAMHPRALEPAIEKNIPTRIKNTFSPEKDGTLIIRKSKIKGKNVAKAIAIIGEVALVTVSGVGMVGTPGVAAKVFSILGENRINVLMISQGSSEANISFIILRRELERALNVLELCLLGSGVVKEISSEADVCVIAVVGAGMKGTLGVAARVFKAVAEAEINVRMIAQGSSELNISFVVQKNDGVKAVRKLHKEFNLG